MMTLMADAGNDWIDAGRATIPSSAVTAMIRLHGKDGDDAITAVCGEDTITGGQGSDVIDGSDGDDTITAGLARIPSQAVRAVISSSLPMVISDEYIDVITDFEIEAAGDLLDLSDIHATSIQNGDLVTAGLVLEWPYYHNYINLLWMETILSSHMIRMDLMWFLEGYHSS